MSGLQNPGMLDALAHDTRTDTLILAMYEDRPWLGSETQLIELQEKLNAYLSFVLDGELIDEYPKLVGKRVRIQLRTVHDPDERALEFIGRVREQLDLQRIIFEVVRIPGAANPDGCAGSDCGCS
jgi:hypothetical protein